MQEAARTKTIWRVPSSTAAPLSHVPEFPRS
jgi:hypothetical protein